MVASLILPDKIAWSTSAALPTYADPAPGMRQVVLAQPRGFCAGVARAIGIVEATLARFGAPVYVRRAIVHNAHVVAHIEALGAITVSDVQEVPEGAVVVFSAHGVSQRVRADAAGRRLITVDATCPLVQKVHDEVRRFVAQGYDVVLVGHHGHDEVTGTLGQAPACIHVVESASEALRVRVHHPGRVACVTQTTLTPADVEPIVWALRSRFPGLAQPHSDDICYATHQRQVATRRLADSVDLVLVFGDPASSNSRRLCEVAESAGRRAHLLGTIADLKPEWLAGARSIGITAGASTPEWVVQEAVQYFRGCGAIASQRTNSTDSQPRRRESVA